MAIGSKAEVRAQKAATRATRAQRNTAAAERQAVVESSAGINTKIGTSTGSSGRVTNSGTDLYQGGKKIASYATDREAASAYNSLTAKPKAQSSATGTGFAPGTRPDVYTVSGGAVMKNGKLVHNYGYGAAAEAQAQARLVQYTSPRRDGRVTGIVGDKGGETYRMLYRTDKGTQTGMANTTDAANAIRSTGMNVQYDEQGNVIGSETKAATQSRTFSPIEAPTSMSVKDRDTAAEEAARARIAEERGIDLERATASQRMLLNEQVNLDVYGEARPNFGTTRTQTKPVEDATLPDYLTDAGDSAVVTADSAEKYLDETLPQIETGFAENSATVTDSLNSLTATDPDIIAAEQEGAEMQALLEQKRSFYEEQYELMRQQIQDIYDSKEADYKDQAAQAMGQAVTMLANMGAFGVTSAGVQYVDSVNRENQAKIAALATEEAAALNQAYSAFMEADFTVATEMITNARAVRQEIRTIKTEALARQKTLMELKQMERENTSQTIETMVASGMDIDSLPDGYLDYLDRKAGYAPGTSAGLYAVAQEERAAAKTKSDIEQAQSLVSLLKDIPYGESVTINGTTYTSLSSGNVQTGIETNSMTGETFAYSYNFDTGEVTSRLIGNFGSMQYDDFTTEGNVVVRRYANGEEVIIHDPSQWSGGLSTGGIISIYPDGTKYGQCGAFVNDLMGTRVGNTDDSKMAITDPSITAETAKVGDIFVQDSSKVGTWTGHIGIINGKFVKNGEVYFKVSESNWNMDEKVTHYREVPASQISGYARGNFVESAYQFNAADSAENTEATDSINEMLGLIETLKNSDFLDNAVGPLASRLPNVRGGTSDFEADFNALVAKLTVDNLSMLKGPMSDKDIEFIKQASSALTLNRSEEGFRKELEKIEAKLRGAVDSVPSGTKLYYTDPNDPDLIEARKNGWGYYKEEGKYVIVAP